MNKDMPERPVQRDIEAGSLRAFESSLPADWESDPRRRDFGIDLDVEIFSEGHATGLMFGVQVKGTGHLSSRPSVRIKWTTWNYWSSQSDPVLVVFWDMETDRLWWEWSHRFDTSLLESDAAGSFSFPFPENQIWDEQTQDKLRREVEAWRAWSTPYTHLPIGVIVRGGGNVAGLPANRFVAALRGRIRQHGDLFAIDGQPDSRRVLGIRVDIGPAESVIWLSGGPSATLHYESIEPVDSDSDSAADRFVLMVTADIMLLIARQFGLMNALGPAARIAGAAIDDASVVHQPEVAVGLLQLLLEENRIDDAVRLLSRLLLAVDSLPGVLALLSLNSVPSLETPHRQRIATALRDMARFQAQTRGGGAELAYNAAQLMRSFDPIVAIELFDEASRLDPAYRERGYWWRERGGCLFLSEQYTEAVEHYQRALEMGELQALPLLADSLMFSGQYRQALEAFRRVIADGELSHPEWRLKCHVLGGLIDMTGIEQQERDTPSALTSLSDSPDLSRLQAALEFDLLCPDALRGLGINAEENGERSVDFFVAEALVDSLHAHAWLGAIRGAVLEDPNMLEDVGSCARRFCGTTILGVLDEESAPSEIVDFVESLFSEAPADPPRPMELRLVEQGSGKYMSVDMGEDSGDEADTTPQ